MEVQKFIDEDRGGRLGMSSSFCRRIYSEVEEVGWEHLVKVGEDMTSLSFRVLDCKGRAQILGITLDKAYPRVPPSVAVDVPYNFNLEWTSKFKLKDVVQQFYKHVCKLEDFYSTLDDVDRSFWVTDSGHSNHAMPYRQIKVVIHCHYPSSDAQINFLKEIWKRNCRRWAMDKLFSENLASVFGTHLCQSPHNKENEEQIECGICYAQHLPIDDELGEKSGSSTDYTCENGSCDRAFHTVCLSDWLRSVTTTRQSFDVLFGNCPYCLDPVAVKLSTKN